MACHIITRTLFLMVQNEKSEQRNDHNSTWKPKKTPFKHNPVQLFRNDCICVEPLNMALRALDALNREEEEEQRIKTLLKYMQTNTLFNVQYRWITSSSMLCIISLIFWLPSKMPYLKSKSRIEYACGNSFIPLYYFVHWNQCCNYTRFSAICRSV